jgi:hypothetical protein
MFSSVARTLGNRHVRDNDHHRASTEEPSALGARDDALIASIDALLDGRYDAVSQDANDPVSKALARLASKLAESASQSLDRVVVRKGRLCRSPEGNRAGRGRLLKKCFVCSTAWDKKRPDGRSAPKPDVASQMTLPWGEAFRLSGFPVPIRKKGMHCCHVFGR